MNRLDSTIASLRESGRKALVGYITAGYPDMDSTVEIAEIFAKNGVDIIELGIPFSDPMADGPAIQAASQYALDHGANLNKILDAVTRIRKRTDVPLIFMSYMNPLFQGGFERTVRAARARGVDGFIIPDLIPEEAGTFSDACRKHDASLIFLAAPNSSNERMEAIDRASNGFVYVVSLTGVTGSRDLLSRDLEKFLGRTRKHITLHPGFLGFGISTPEHVAQVKAHVDGVIVGSAFISIIRDAENVAERNARLIRLVKSLRSALDR
jgi:tryptophan synthase alpha chain